jgi:hypothetical protein
MPSGTSASKRAQQKRRAQWGQKYERAKFLLKMTPDQRAAFMDDTTKVFKELAADEANEAKSQATEEEGLPVHLVEALQYLTAAKDEARSIDPYKLNPGADAFCHDRDGRVCETCAVSVTWVPCTSHETDSGEREYRCDECTDDAEAAAEDGGSDSDDEEEEEEEVVWSEADAIPVGDIFGTTGTQLGLRCDENADEATVERATLVAQDELRGRIVGVWTKAVRSLKTKDGEAVCPPMTDFRMKMLLSGRTISAIRTAIRATRAGALLMKRAKAALALLP